MNPKDLRAANISRDAIWDPERKLNLDFFLNELGGELGEAMNVLKKLDREARGIRGSRATLDDLEAELADIAICIDLVAWKAGCSILMWTNPVKIGLKNHSHAGTVLFSIVSSCIEAPTMDNLDEAIDRLCDFAHSYGINLAEVIPRKFNSTSTKYNLPIFIGVDHV